MTSRSVENSVARGFQLVRLRYSDANVRTDEAQVMERIASSVHPPRDNYRLTTKGRGHWPVLNAVRHWVNGYAAPDGPPISLVHKNGGEEAHANLVCSECGEPMDARSGRRRGTGGRRAPSAGHVDATQAVTLPS